jgi:GNAT superfamily N-acetyltransferase
MDILTYDQIDDKQTLLPLFYRAFGHPFDPWWFERRREGNLRLLGDRPDAFIAVEDGVPAGLVGVMDLPTRTLNGEEIVGGLWSVFTHPSFTRRGVASVLMERAHQHYRDKGIRLVFLTTNSSWGAYRLYRNLGYEDVPWPSTRIAYKVIPPERRGRAVELQQATEEQVLGLFTAYCRNKTGFVLRPSGFLGQKMEFSPLKQEVCLATQDGYVLAAENRGGAQIKEIVAFTREAQDRLLDALEGQGSLVVDPMVVDDGVFEGYRARGYGLSQGTFGVLMCNILAPELDMRSLYGDSFYACPLVPI